MSDTHAHTPPSSGPRCCRNRRRPSRRPGPIKWLRENLFSSWLNAILTILSLYVIYWVLSHVISGWMLNGIWDAGSACRNAARSGTRPMAKDQRGLLGRPDGPLGPADVRLLPVRALLAPVLALILFLVAIAPVLLRHAAAQDAAVHAGSRPSCCSGSSGAARSGADRGGSGLRPRLGIVVTFAAP
jgi:general L-amino acid transport system permease protein